MSDVSVSDPDQTYVRSRDVGMPSILVAVDPTGPPPTSPAIDTLALATGWSVVLINALSSDTTEEAIEDAKKRLTESAATFAERGIEARGDALVGPPVDVIIAEAEAVNAAVIVVGAHRNRFDGRAEFDHVTSALLATSDRPILVLPIGPGPSRPDFMTAVDRLIDLVETREEVDCLAELRDAAIKLRSEPSEANHRRLDRRLRNTLHQFETDHPVLTAAVNDVAYYLSGMGL